MRAFTAGQWDEWFFRFVIWDHFFHKLIHLNYWSEILRPPLSSAKLSEQLDTKRGAPIGCALFLRRLLICLCFKNISGGLEGWPSSGSDLQSKFENDRFNYSLSGRTNPKPRR
jgi:hypothetical protein